MNTATEPAITNPSFTADRLERLLQMGRWHFWFAGRRILVDRLLDQHLQGRRVADLGTGAGTTAERLSSFGLQVTAVDFLPQGLARLRKAAPRVRTVQSSAECLALEDSSFDGVLLLDVIEHLDDARVLSEARRILRPGGALFVTVPAFPWLWSYRDDAAGHRRRYTRGSLEQALAAAGFELREMCFYQCLLFPLAVAARWAGRRGPGVRDAEDMPPAWLNGWFTRINRAEVKLGRWVRWPWGSSLAAVGVKRAGDGW